jgi:diacylglycerol diphosphate phosphatase/phosphatidate phosphatase
MSFPSGHSCAAFAGFGFLALYLNAKFDIFAHRAREGMGWRRTHHWKMLLFVAPLLFAVIVAASKVRDGWHHPVDVVGGAVIGSSVALMAYKMVYRGVWNQEKNHVAME